MGSYTVSYGICVVIAVLLNIIHPSEPASIAQQGLYGPSDKIVILNDTSIRETLYGTPNAWLVEFYRAWCGYCISFAPLYKEFALAVDSWQSVVKIAAIDCSVEDHVSTCRDYGAIRVPRIWFFPPNSEQTRLDEDGNPELNNGIRFEKSYDVTELKQDLIKVLTPHFPSVLGSVDPDAIESLDDIWKSVRSLTPAGTELPSLLVIYYENEDESFNGRELALSLSSYPEIRVLRFSKKNSIYEKLGFKEEFPAVGYLKSDQSSGILPLEENDQDAVPSLHTTILKMMNIEEVTSPKPETTTELMSQGDANGEKPEPNNFEDVVSVEDLIHAVRNSLRNEVGLEQTITGSKLKVLKEYTHILAELLPVDKKGMTEFLTKLSKWVETRQDEIQIKDFLEKLVELETELNPWDIDVDSWGTCSGTIPGRRGYTCSLWRVFHTLTVVGAQKANISALPIVHGYVKEFFGCEECVKHFTGLVKKEDALSITDPKAQAMWLWQAHNQVNKRLKGTASEDPGFPKGPYPSRFQCAECYKSEDDDESFDEDKVFEYLTNVYSNPMRTT